MSKQKKNRVHLIEEKLESLTQTKWAKRLRITSGVAWNLFLLFLVFGITATVFAASVGAGYFASLVATEPLRTKEDMRNHIFSYEETSEIYLANNVYLGPVSADIVRKEIKLEDVSPYVIDAVLATEDEYFETHPGVVPKAIFRGLFQDVTNSDSQTGGSTLTQQLIKLQVLTNEVSYERKAKEILLAMRLEHFMKKEEILEAYLNIIPYGRNANGDNVAGIEAASEGIFNVKAKDLTLPQAAFIAGIPQSPFAYTPFYNQNQGVKEAESLKPGIDRMKTVLFRMKETEYITEKEYNEALAYDITKDFRDAPLRTNERYPYLTQEIQKRTVDILAEILAEKDDIDPSRLKNEKKLLEKYEILARRSITNDGYRIYSTIDLKLNDRLNEVAKEFPHYGHTYSAEVKDPDTGEVSVVEEPVQVGGIIIENSTGKILSFIGGRDHSKEALNHATQAWRQNGSSMKPLLVFGPAIEFGETGAGSPVVDVKFSIMDNGKPWGPENYNASQELGIIPARQALATSQNLATTRLYNQIKDKDPSQFLTKMGFTNTVAGGLADALGTVETTVEENTNAYGTFANGGKFIPSYMIEKIEDMDGNLIYEHKIEPVDVFSPQTAYIMSDMLRDVTKYGTATTMKNNLNFSMDIAAKTGTTQNYKDGWLVGYNPNISLGVWIGYSKPEKHALYDIRNGYLHPGQRTNLLFAQLMNAANEVIPDIISSGDQFQQPEGVVSRSFCGISGLAPSAACSAAGLVTSDLFNAAVMLPTKADDSIISASYVSVQGTKYLALPSTPSEFIVKGGTGVSESFIKRMLGPLKGDASKLFPKNSKFASNVVSGAVFEPDDANPAAVKAILTDKKMTWGASSSNDVIGYYVYSKDGKKIATIRDGESYSHSIGTGSYYVVAVDITGRLSGPSNTVTIEEEVPDKDDEKGKDKDKPPKDDKPGEPEEEEPEPEPEPDPEEEDEDEDEDEE